MSRRGGVRKDSLVACSRRCSARRRASVLAMGFLPRDYCSVARIIEGVRRYQLELLHRVIESCSVPRGQATCAIPTSSGASSLLLLGWEVRTYLCSQRIPSSWGRFPLVTGAWLKSIDLSINLFFFSIILFDVVGVWLDVVTDLLNIA